MSLRLPSDFTSGLHQEQEWKTPAPVRWIQRVELIGRKPARCIRVSAPDHLYVTDGFILTHNTVQSVSFMSYIASKKRPGPFLVIAPLSALPHWERETHRWTGLNCVVYSGSKESRALCRKKSFYTRDAFGRRTFRFHILVTTYGIILQDLSLLSAIRWELIVVDEAQRIKNHESKLAIALRHNMKFHRSLLLTGTPIQNNTMELWALLNFLDPQAFRDAEAFTAEFGDMKDVETAQRLHDTLRMYMLRRLKGDVEKSLPPKDEVLIHVPLTTLQKKYYRAVYEKNAGILNRLTRKRGSENNRVILNNIPMQLRKICNHPYLINGVEESERLAIWKTKLRKHHSAYRKTRRLSPEARAELNRLTEERLVTSCGKFILLERLLRKLMSNRHKILLFSQMTRLLDILSDFLVSKGIEFERIDGSVHGDARQQAIDRFSAPNSKTQVFLISSRAGGTGINLTAADTVIIYDSDWNPQNDLQAQARCHRIGQDKPVKVYRFISKGTYEEAVFQRSSMKLALDQAILHGGREEEEETNGAGDGQERKTGHRNRGGAFTPPTAEEIEKMLRRGAYAVFGDDGGLISFPPLSFSLTIDRSIFLFSSLFFGRIFLFSSLFFLSFFLFHSYYWLLWVVVRIQWTDSSQQLEQSMHSEEALDALLERSQVKLDSGEPQSSSHLGVANFSRASFVYDGEDVDVEDPQFWSRIGLEVSSCPFFSSFFFFLVSFPS